MRLYQTYIVILLLLIPIFSSAQQSINCDEWDYDSGLDLFPFDSISYSISKIDPVLLQNAELVVCPAGIKRSSPDDNKKRLRFDWISKYNNIYIKSAQGIVFEGMNEHGFSASLMYLKNSQLPEKDKEHLPIAASLVVNFFIDHFKSIDTALLAIWDIRIFDDVGLDCGWPFRIVLHDSGGATVYLEYTDGKRYVYTPAPPALIVGGPDYTRLLSLKYFADSIPKGASEIRFRDIMMSCETPMDQWRKIQEYDENKPGEVHLYRDHGKREILILGESEKKRSINFSETDFSKEEESIEKIL